MSYLLWIAQFGRTTFPTGHTNNACAQSERYFRRSDEYVSDLLASRGIPDDSDTLRKRFLKLSANNLSIVYYAPGYTTTYNRHGGVSTEESRALSFHRGTMTEEQKRDGMRQQRMRSERLSAPAPSGRNCRQLLGPSRYGAVGQRRLALGLSSNRCGGGKRESPLCSAATAVADTTPPRLLNWVRTPNLLDPAGVRNQLFAQRVQQARDRLADFAYEAAHRSGRNRATRGGHARIWKRKRGEASTARTERSSSRRRSVKTWLRETAGASDESDRMS